MAEHISKNHSFFFRSEVCDNIFLLMQLQLLGSVHFHNQ